MLSLCMPTSNFLNRISVIKSAFSPWINKPVWVQSGTDKIPKHPGGKPALINDPASWVTFEKLRCDSDFLGALALPGTTNLCVLDIDNCIDSTGNLSTLAQELREQFPSYTEVSRSGSGLHIFFYGEKPHRQCRLNGIEIYDSSDKRFITLTGNVHENRSRIVSVDQLVIEDFFKKHFPQKEKLPTSTRRSPPLSNAEVLQCLNKAANGDKFRKLFYEADTTQYSEDDSAADFALVSLISFYTQDEEQIFSIFKESALYMSAKRQTKWSRDDYRKATIGKALQSLGATYQVSTLREAIRGAWNNPIPMEFSENTDAAFPIEALPACLRAAVEEVARFACVDSSIPLIPALGMLCLSAGKKVMIEEKPGLFHHPSLFLVGVMESGDRKSTVYQVSLSLIMEALETERPSFEKEKASVEAFNELVRESAEVLKKARRKGEIGAEEAQDQLRELYASRKKIPAEPENFADDITSPRLFQKLHLHDGAFGVFSSDARKIFSRIIGRGSNEGVSEEDIYISAMWGDTIYRSRVTGGESGHGEDSLIKKPALTVCALIQRDLWKSFATNQTMRDSGLIARVCVVNPVSLVGRRIESEDDLPFDKEKLRIFSDAVIRIRRWKVQQPVLIKLGVDASKARRTFYNEIERESGPGGRYEDVRDIASRVTSITTRIAGVLALLEYATHNELNDSIPDITHVQWLHAQQVGEYFFAQALDMQRRSGTKSEAYLLQKTARWLLKYHREKHNHVSLAVLRNRVRGLEDEEISQNIITALKQAAWIKKLDHTRKDSVSYEINPLISEFHSEE